MRPKVEPSLCTFRTRSMENMATVSDIEELEKYGHSLPRYTCRSGDLIAEPPRSGVLRMQKWKPICWEPELKDSQDL